MERTRQLAAIMFTDIQGYTALMQQNEEKAVQSRDKHRLIFNSITKKHNGKILQYYGDGTLSIFDSAIDAVNCAIEMQVGFQEEPAIPVRIGIHTGDIIFSEEEIIGDGVNVASRIESLALPGSVLISGKVFDEIKNQESIKATFLKMVNLKNVDRPLGVYAITNTGLAIPKVDDIISGPGKSSQSFPGTKVDAKPKIKKGYSIALAIAAFVAVLIFIYIYFGINKSSPPDISEKSIAVLPFLNMSNDPEQEYFSDGISEEILNSLVKIEGLKVAGRTSSFSFKGKEEDVRIIGEKLDVKMVLEGSVRKAENQLLITAQLINVEDGFHLFSEKYIREMKDIFAVQEEIANHIAEKLKLHVREVSKNEVRTKNVEAYELVLKGSYFMRRSYEDTKKSMAYFQKAVELDPEYAEAYAYIGETYLHFAGFNLMATSEAYVKSRTAAQKAISLNEWEPRAHKVLAFIHLFYDWDWEASITEYNKAVEYGLPEQNQFITYHDIFLNKDYNRAIRISKEILETDPLHIENHWQVGICYYFAARFEEALLSFNDALELNQNYSDGHHWKGLVLAYLGRFDEANSSLDKSLEITEGEGLAIYDKLVVKILMGKKDEALQTIKTMEFIDPMDAARLYSIMEMPDEAIEWMEKGYRERSVMMVTLKNFWIWDPIRKDPRFIEIYNRMNFAE